MQPWKRRILTESTHLPSQLWQVPVLVRTANRHIDASQEQEAQKTRIELPTDEESLEILRRVRSRILMSTYRVQGVAGGRADWRSVFGKYDLNHNGDLSLDELVRAVRAEMRIGPKELSNDDIGRLFRVLDVDNSGGVTITELLAFIHATGISMRQRREVTDDEVKKKLLRAAAKVGVQPKDWLGLFQRYGQDGSSALTVSQLRQAVRRDLKLSQWEFTEQELRHLYSQLDGCGSSAAGVGAANLVAFLYGQTEESCGIGSIGLGSTRASTFAIAGTSQSSDAPVGAGENTSFSEFASQWRRREALQPPPPEEHVRDSNERHAFSKSRKDEEKRRLEEERLVQLEKCRADYEARISQEDFRVRGDAFVTKVEREENELMQRLLNTKTVPKHIYDEPDYLPLRGASASPTSTTSGVVSLRRGVGLPGPDRGCWRRAS